MKTQDNTLFITGGASGIGLATAKFFAARGWRVGLSDRDGARAAAEAAEIGPQVTAFTADVLDPASLTAALTAFVGHGGTLRALFNSAGILEMRPFSETALARLHAVADINFKGVINAIHAGFPFVKANGAGSIVTMSSVAAVYGIPEEAVYAASKFAVRGLTEALNIELAAEGVWVSDIMVAYVRTPMVMEADRQARSVGILGVNIVPEQVAQTVWDAVHGQRVHWYVTEADAGVATQVDALDWQQRRALIAQITGF